MIHTMDICLRTASIGDAALDGRPMAHDLNAAIMGTCGTKRLLVDVCCVEFRAAATVVCLMVLGDTTVRFRTVSRADTGLTAAAARISFPLRLRGVAKLMALIRVDATDEPKLPPIVDFRADKLPSDEAVLMVVEVNGRNVSESTPVLTNLEIRFSGFITALGFRSGTLTSVDALAITDVFSKDTTGRTAFTN